MNQKRLQRERKRLDRQYAKQERQLRKFIIAILIVIPVLACTILGGMKLNHHLLVVKAEQDLAALETQILSQMTTTNVSPDEYPAAIYQHNTKSGKNYFCCIGTAQFDKDKHRWQLITSEHIFRSDINHSVTLAVKIFRSSKNPPLMYVDGFIKTSKELNNNDIVILSLGETPAVISSFSKFTDELMVTNFWADVVIRDKKIPTLRSELSGKTVETVGYSQQKLSNGNYANFIMVDTKALVGESGTGYIDAQNGLWVLHGGPDEGPANDEMVRDCKKYTGRDIGHLQLLSGPIGGNYD